MKKPHIENEPPPIMKKWSRLYWLMMITLVGLILFFYFFRKVFE